MSVAPLATAPHHELFTTEDPFLQLAHSRRASDASSDIWEDAKTTVSLSPISSTFTAEERPLTVDCPTFTPKPLMLARSGPESLRRQARTSKACSRAQQQSRPPSPSLNSLALSSLDIDALIDACNPEEMLDYLQELNASSDHLQRTPPQSSLAVFADGHNDPERTPRPPQRASFEQPKPQPGPLESPDVLESRPYQQSVTSSILFPRPPLHASKGPAAPRSSASSSQTVRPRRNTGAAPPVPARTTAVPFEVATSMHQQQQRPAYGRSTSLIDRPSELPYRNTFTEPTAPLMSRSTASSRSSQSTTTTASSGSESDVLRWSSSAPSTAPTSPASSPRLLEGPCDVVSGRSRSGSDFSMMSAFSSSVAPPASAPGAYSSESLSSSGSSSRYAWESSFSSSVWGFPEDFAPAAPQQDVLPGKPKSRPNSGQTTASTLTGSTEGGDQLQNSSGSNSSSASVKSIKTKKSFKSLGKLFKRTPSQANLKAASLSQQCDEPPMPPWQALEQYRPSNGLRLH